MAPELLSNEGRIVIMVAYVLLFIIGLYGWSQFKIDFIQEWLIGETTYVYDFYQLNDQYFKLGY